MNTIILPLYIIPTIISAVLMFFYVKSTKQSGKDTLELISMAIVPMINILIIMSCVVYVLHKAFTKMVSTLK
jgi:hypothetical protein